MALKLIFYTNNMVKFCMMIQHMTEVGESLLRPHGRCWQ